MKIVFMGTPDFSVPALKNLIDAGHDVAAVVTQPDKPKGRGGKMQFTPVKEAAVLAGITVYQPQKVREPEFISILEKINADVIVVIAFGQLLPEVILNMPKYGCINVHASLLPKYRGAAPIQWAVINGESKTGVTTMYMDKGLDTGDIIDTVVVPIDHKETGGSLFDKLSKAGAKIILETLDKLEKGTAVRIKQDDIKLKNNDEKTRYASMINKEMGKIDFDRPALEIERLIRGLTPWPSAYTTMSFETQDGSAEVKKNVKIWDAEVIDEQTQSAPGEIVDCGKSYINVATGNGILKIKELQMEGKKRMPVNAFLNGISLKISKLGG